MEPSSNTALVVGATGIAGQNLARHLVGLGWSVDGLSRRAADGLDGVRPVLVDLRDERAVREAVQGARYTHVFHCSWSPQPTEAENCAVNGAMFRNVLEPVLEPGTLRHVALVTGLKHYQGPFEAYAQVPAETPFREELPRLELQNFYYDLEDIMLDAAERAGFAWSVHRSHTMIGWALGNAMNMGVTLSVYGTICREQGRPFVFPGTPVQYEGITDMTDAILLAEHMVWAATEAAAANQAFNVVNGDVFRWRRMWSVLADELGAEVGDYPGHARSLEAEMSGQDEVWDSIVAKHGLRPLPLGELASWWHSDGDLGREVESFADMTKSWTLGFRGFRRTDDSFRALIRRLRAERVIPTPDEPRTGR
jgi:nucleoside-diphosphate-sugar epimerase